MFFITVLFALIQASEQDLRLIDFGPNTEPKWMTQLEVEELMAKPVHNFMDITDFQDVSASEVIDVTATFPSQPTHKQLVTKLNTFLSTNNMKTYNDKLTSFFTRYYTTETGEQAANFIYDELTDLSSGNPAVTVTKFKHSFRQPSIIARYAGFGPNKDEIVVLGCHEDSTAGGASRRSPGSDDDGSGSMTVLEVFRLIMKEGTNQGFKPDRTIEFHFYAGEEAGLLGSQAVAANYKAAGKKVYAMMQLDMTIWPGKNPRFGIIEDYVNKDLTTFLRTLVEAYSKLKYVNSRCGYGCSDHASWNKNGYASCFPFEGAFADISPYIHTSQDTLDKYSLDHGLEFAKVAVGFVVELSSFSSRTTE